MSLRVRIIAIFVVTLLALLGTLQWVSVDVLLKSYQKLENQFASRNLSSLQTNLKTYIEHLDGQVNDWAPWDDTYQFMIDQNPDYIANNLNEDTLENLNIHAALYLDPQGKIVYAKGIDLQTGKETPVSEGLFDSIQTNLDDYNFDDEADGVQGVIRLPEGAMAIAARPIMTSQKAGPIRGALIFGRYIDESFLASVAIPGQKLSAHALVDASLPREALEALTPQNPTFISAQNDDTITGYLLLTDVNGAPAGFLVDEGARYIYPQGKITVQYFLVYTVAIMLGAVVLLWLVLYFLFLRRIVDLSGQVHQVAVSKDFSANLRVSGRDEIARLGHGFEDALQAISQSQQALKASEEKYRGLVENLVDWVWELDEREMFTFCSPRVQSLLGYAPETLIGKSVFELMTVEDAAQVQTNLAPFISKRESFAMVTMRFTRIDGAARILEVSGSPIFTPAGEYQGYLGIGRDVTEHWEHENALSRSEKKYRSLFNYIPDAVYIYARDTLQLLDWNQAMTRIYGYNDNELREFTPINLYAPEDAGKARSEVETPDLDCPIDTTHLTKHGRRMDVEILMDVIDYQGRPAWIALVRDVTERKRTEDALRLERDIVQSIFASSPDAITIIDLNGMIIDCNQALLDMFGRTRKEGVVGDTIFDSIVPSEALHARTSLVEAVESGLLRNVEFMCRRAGGALFPTENSAGLLRDPNGAPRYIVVLSKDITERKRAERIQAATFRISQAVNSSATLDELFHSIYSILNELFPARNLFFALYDETKDLLRFPFFVDEYDPPPPPKKPGKGITEYVLRTGKPLLATPAVFDDLVAQGEVESIGAPSLDWLGVPLKVKGRTIGVLVTQTYDVNRRLGEKEIDILNFVSDQVAMAIDRKMAETLRMESEARLRRITDNMLDLVSETGPDGVIRYASPSHTAVLGYQPDALVGKSIRELLHEEDQEKFAENLATALSQKRATRNELRFLHADGYTLWMDVMSNPLFNEKGETIGAVHGSRDISGRKQAEEALRQSEERYRNLVEYQGEGICILDPIYRFLFANPAAERIFGVEADGLTGRNLEDFIDPDSLGVLETQKGQRESGAEGTYEIEVRRPGGEQRSLLITSTPWMDTSGDYIGSFMIFRDISERKQVEEKLHFLSMHDALTGLFNRAYFEEQIALMECAPKGPISVVFTDLNGLKVTNDTLGHATGDELLRQAAIMLRTAFRGDDVVARIGGDEFGVLLPGVDAPAAEKAVQRLRSRIAEHNRKKNALQISIAIGVATSEGESLREMLNLADQRMYADKPRHPRPEGAD